MKKSSVAWLLFAGLLIVCLGLFWSVRPLPDSPPKQGTKVPAGIPAPPKTQVVDSVKPQPPDAPLPPSALIDKTLDRLRNGVLEPGELDAFRKQLLAGAPDETIAAIKDFLASGRDALTGENFAVGPAGELGGAPTLRVLLLDLLGRISREEKRPDGAVLARQLLERKTSADEWAIALRNVGWSESKPEKYLASKMREMLSEKAWRQQPSGGYLEAFDVMVFSRDAQFVPDLVDMMTGEPGPLKRASAVALDRLSAMAPLEVMSNLNANPGELAEQPFLRADYFAKADLAHTEQRRQVEAYLDRKDVSLEEKAKFFSAIVAPGVFVSDNLLTPPPAPEDPPYRVEHLKLTAEQWVKANRFPELAPLIQRFKNRLQY